MQRPKTRPPNAPPPGDTRSLQRPRLGGAGGGVGGTQGGVVDRSTFSLPRTAYERGAARMPHHDMQPDFYFMPSQRKYSGEVVRVYVDYNGQNK